MELPPESPPIPNVPAPFEPSPADPIFNVGCAVVTFLTFALVAVVILKAIFWVLFK